MAASTTPVTHAPPAPAPVRTAIQAVFRSFPFATEPGLRVFGDPGRDAPVFVTSNFDHTVRLVSRVLHELDIDCYLLIAPTGGVNVWCAAAGGHFGADEVDAAIRLSGIDHLVDHHRLVLPRLAAAGVDPKQVRRQTGWRVVFGPIDVTDLPEWLDTTFPRLSADRVRFEPRTRLEMGLGAALWPAGIVGLPVALLGGAVTGLVTVAASYVLSLLFALVYPRLPLRPGLPQAVALATLLGGVGLGIGLVTGGLAPTVLYAAAGTAMGALIALDFPSWSPTDVCKQQLLCFLYPATLAPPGFLPTIDEPRCIDGCDICVKVCPKGALELTALDKATLTDPDGCVSCYACVQQCPVDAIS